MYMWREFDIGEIRDELAQISDIGFDTVRLFALTQDFLPSPGPWLQGWLPGSWK